MDDYGKQSQKGGAKKRLNNDEIKQMLIQLGEYDYYSDNDLNAFR